MRRLMSYAGLGLVAFGLYVLTQLDTPPSVTPPYYIGSVLGGVVFFIIPGFAIFNNFRKPKEYHHTHRA